MASAPPPLKQEIELKDFKGDLFGVKFSLIKDDKTGEVMFDFVQLPEGFDVKRIKFFRVKGKDIATVEAELKKLLQKDVPTAETNTQTQTPFVKKTATELALLDEMRIAEHISAGLAAKAYTVEESDALGKEAERLRKEAAAAAAAPGTAEAEAPGTGAADEALVTEDQRAAVGPPPFAMANATQLFKAYLRLNANGSLAGKTAEDVTRFLDEQVGLTPERREEAEGILTAALAQNNPARGFTNLDALDGGRRSTKQTKKSKTRKHKK